MSLGDHSTSIEHNYFVLKDLRHNQQRSMFLQKSPFRPHSVAFYDHPASQSALRVAGASRFPAPKETGWPRSLS